MRKALFLIFIGKILFSMESDAPRLDSITNNTNVNLVLTKEGGSSSTRAAEEGVTELEDGRQLMPEKIEGYLTVRSNTKVFLKNAFFPSSGDKHNFYYQLYWSQGGTSGHKENPIIAFRRMGQLLEIRNNNHKSASGSRNFFINNEEVQLKSLIPNTSQFLGKKLLNDNHYALEVENGFVVKIKDSIDSYPNLASYASASIKSYKPSTLSDGIVKTTLQFNTRITPDYLELFLKTFKDKINTCYGNATACFGTQTVNCEFFDDIKEDVVQELVDQVNQQLNIENQ